MQFDCITRNVLQYFLLSGGLSEVEPPVPIPNTEVKRLSADDTEGATPWENMSLPEGITLSQDHTYPA